MIDKHGFRLNVGIILANTENRLFWGRRVGKFDAWQFAQGGMHENETPEESMYRELYEELGLLPPQVELLAVTKRWLSYYIPRHLRRRDYQKSAALQVASTHIMDPDICTPEENTTSDAGEQTQGKISCIGQKQRWFLLRLRSDDTAISFTLDDSPEFLRWKWVDYWYPIKHVVTFKKKVYKTVLEEFEPILFK